MDTVEVTISCFYEHREPGSGGKFELDFDALFFGLTQEWCDPDRGLAPLWYPYEIQQEDVGGEVIYRIHVGFPEVRSLPIALILEAAAHCGHRARFGDAVAYEIAIPAEWGDAVNVLQRTSTERRRVIGNVSRSGFYVDPRGRDYFRGFPADGVTRVPAILSIESGDRCSDERARCVAALLRESLVAEPGADFETAVDSTSEGSSMTYQISLTEWSPMIAGRIIRFADESRRIAGIDTAVRIALRI